MPFVVYGNDIRSDNVNEVIVYVEKSIELLLQVTKY